MSFVYLPVQAEESSEASSTDGGSSAMSRTTPIVSKSSKPESKTASMTMPPSGMTLEHSTGDRGVDAWILSLRDSPALPSPLPVNEREPMTSVTCGPKHSVSLARFDPDTHSLRTSQGLLALDTLEPSCVTLPRAGTMLNGVCWERTMLAHRIDGSDCGYWRTPEAGDSANRTFAINSRGEPKLSAQVKAPGYWPTARTRGLLGGSGSREMVQDKLKRGEITEVEAEQMMGVKMWPTPSTQECTGGPGKVERIKEQGHQIKLKDAVAASPGGTPTRRMYPIPRASETEGGATGGKDGTKQEGLTHLIQKQEKKGQLNPDWVEWLQGVPIGLTALKPLEICRFREWLERHGGC